jgi:hypothetical protein
MAEERWGVEIRVAGFGPNHPLWHKFTEHATLCRQSSLRWILRDDSDRDDKIPGIRAITQADSAQAAIRLVMTAIREVGRSVDRYNEVVWADMEGTAYRL